VQHYAESAAGTIVLRDSVPSARAAYLDLPGAQVWTVSKFLLENLHPPAFLLLSYLMARHLDAAAGYRSVFLLPDSFVAMSARDASAGAIERPFQALLFACPALLLTLQLVWVVARDGTRRGMSRRARVAWSVGMVLFGLPAYVTYRRARPQGPLVTCANCGLGRRPDRDKCHHCGSPWVVPELTPPAWRVLGVSEPVEESPFSREPQADSQVQ
jgi:hypothetical protein